MCTSLVKNIPVIKIFEVILVIILDLLNFSVHFWWLFVIVILNGFRINLNGFRVT